MIIKESGVDGYEMVCVVEELSFIVKGIEEVINNIFYVVEIVEINVGNFVVSLQDEF